MKILAAFALVTLASVAAAAPAPEAERNLALLRQYGELGRRGDYAAQAAMWAPDAVNNGRPMSIDEIRSQLEDIHRAFPDHQSLAVETAATGDLVIVLTRTSGTHRGVARTGIYGGMLKGAAPLGRHFDVLRAHWWRFKDGKIAWHQVVSDDLTMMRQLGLIPDGLPADEQPAPASLVREGVTEQLTQHVWVIPDGSANLVPNVGIIVGKQAVLVVDTGMGTRNAETVLREVARVGTGKPIYIVTTHVHPEHDMGAHAFPKGSKLIRSRAQLEDIAAGAGMNLVPVFAARSELNRQLLEGAHHRNADITFDDAYTVDLGGMKAQLFAMGTNHTHGDTAVLVDGVLFSGDVAMKPQPAFANPAATITHWLASLDRLEGLKAKRIVPSHGPMGGNEIIAGYRVYLTRIRDRTAALRLTGKTQDEAIQLITDEMSGEYPDKNRLAGAIRAGYSEAK